jgi:predicted RNA-binding Zn ribbon-like protein
MAIRKDFGFIGRLCLDFAQTGDMGFGERFERLTTSSELGRWLSLSPLGLARVTLRRGDLERARALRSAIWRVADALVHDHPPPARDVKMINAMARQSSLVRQLGADAGELHWHRPTTSAALATIAQDAVLLFGDEHQRARLRRCENPGCRAVFYDDSRPGTRRWCASNRCGDRIRARSYRRRQKR